MEKIAQGWVRDPCLSAIFFILYERSSALTFLVDKLFVLATYSDSKLVMYITNSTVFSICSAVLAFSEECCMEK